MDESSLSYCSKVQSNLKAFVGVSGVSGNYPAHTKQQLSNADSTQNCRKWLRLKLKEWKSVVKPIAINICNIISEHLGEEYKRLVSGNLTVIAGIKLYTLWRFEMRYLLTPPKFFKASKMHFSIVILVRMRADLTIRITNANRRDIKLQNLSPRILCK